jgi:membrane protease YdiL (CAAX protease family)
MKDRYKETINGLTEKELLFHLFATQIFLLTISIFLGMIMFDGLAEFKKIVIWNDIRIFTVGLAAAVAVVIADLTLMKYLPASYYDDGGLNERIFKNRTVVEIALIAAVVAISEEILFRGMIQTSTGLFISSLIFAVIHYRYLFNWFLFLNIILLSFLIGYIFMQTNNLLVTIAMHFFIDFLLGLTIRFRAKAPDGGTISE